MQREQAEEQNRYGGAPTGIRPSDPTITGTATSNVATKAADATRATGDKFGEKIPGTAQNEAAKKP